MAKDFPQVDVGKEIEEGNWDVLVWRYGELERAGYPVQVALGLAVRKDIDLHVACNLLATGASIAQAVRILT